MSAEVEVGVAVGVPLTVIEWHGGDVVRDRLAHATQAELALLEHEMATHERTVDRVRVYRDEAGEWRWSAQAANGRKLADSGEGYDRRGAAEEMARTLFPSADFETIEEV